MAKRLAIHDLATEEPTLCLYDPETETCLVLATFEQPSKAELLDDWLQDNDILAMAAAVALDD